MTGSFVWRDAHFFEVPISLNRYVKGGENLMWTQHQREWYTEAQTQLVSTPYYTNQEERVYDPINRQAALYPASIQTIEGRKWGYIDAKGIMMLSPIYDEAREFQPNDLAIVRMKDKYGTITRNGQYRIRPTYDTILPYQDQRAVVVDQEGFKVIDEFGAVLTKKAYSFINPFQEGRALCSVSDDKGITLYGYLNLDGKEIIPTQYKNAYDFVGGKASVQIKDNQFALINTNGERLHTYNYPFVGNLGEGLLRFQATENGKYGYINEEGNIVIKPQFTNSQPFQEGRAVINNAPDYGNQYGLIDKSGKVIIKPIYNDLLQIGSGRIAVGKAIKEGEPFIGSHYAIATNNGRFLTDFVYNQVSMFEKGLSSATNNDTTFFIDEQGKIVQGLPILKGTGMLTVDRSLIKADVDNQVSYLTRSGQIVWEENDIVTLNNRFQLHQKKYRPNKDYLVYYPQVEGMKVKSIQENVNNQLKTLSKVVTIDPIKQLDYSYTGNYSISMFKKNLLVIELNGYQYYFGAAHGMPTKTYPHINLINGKFYKLDELFIPGSDYQKVINDLITKQIKQNPQYSYVFPDSFQGISNNQPFYVSEYALHIYFTPYEIAPYAAGFPTFTIPYPQINEIINKKGEFWRSFQ